MAATFILFTFQAVLALFRHARLSPIRPVKTRSGNCSPNYRCKICCMPSNANLVEWQVVLPCVIGGLEFRVLQLLN